MLCLKCWHFNFRESCLTIWCVSEHQYLLSAMAVSLHKKHIRPSDYFMRSLWIFLRGFMSGGCGAIRVLRFTSIEKSYFYLQQITLWYWYWDLATDKPCMLQVRAKESVKWLWRNGPPKLSAELVFFRVLTSFLHLAVMREMVSPIKRHLVNAYSY